MISNEPLVSVNNVSYRYETEGESDVLALDGVSFDIFPGEFIGLIGQNGSGKTTLARHLNALLKPTRGRVLVNGRDTDDTETGSLAGSVGYVFQNPDHALFLTTVREEIAYGLGYQQLSESERNERILEALAAFELEAIADQHPASFGRGTRRMIVLAAAWAMSPDLLVLDEPTGGLDHRHTSKLMKILSAYVQTGRSVLLISHDMQLIANSCPRVLAVGNGRLIADTTAAAIFSNSSTLQDAGLHTPDVARLARALSGDGVPPETVSIDGFVDCISELSGRTRGRSGR